jgi:lambda repressor-like predicted transcriptional regulator
MVRICGSIRIRHQRDITMASAFGTVAAGLRRRWPKPSRLIAPSIGFVVTPT